MSTGPTAEPEPDPAALFQPTAGTTLKMIAFAILILVTILGNFFVLLAVCLDRRILRTTTNYFITCLAVADFLVGLLVMPFAAVRNVLDDVWVFGVAYCHIWINLYLWLQSASILSICSISLDRYIGVTRPLRYPVLMTRRRAGGLIVIIWILSFVGSVIPARNFSIGKLLNESERCVYYYDTEDVVFVVLGNFYIPMIIVLTFYGRIFQVVRAHERSKKVGKIQGAGIINNVGNGTVEMMRVHHGGYNDGQPQQQTTRDTRESAFTGALVFAGSPITLLVTKFQNQEKVAKQLSFCVGAFIMCWLPYFTLETLIGFGVTNRASLGAMQVFIWFGYLNSGVNPFIYVASSKQYREALRKIFGTRSGEASLQSQSS